MNECGTCKYVHVKLLEYPCNCCFWENSYHPEYESVINEVIKPKKQIFSDIDPYGEEDWNE